MPLRLTPGQIADPIHGYVSFTSIERAMIDHRVTQRLRYVAQSGFAHLVYPELRTSRFSHSLGAMHLASKFLIASLQNAEPGVRDLLCTALGEALKLAIGEMFSIEDIAAPLKSEPLLAVQYADRKFEDVLLLVEQSLRLASVFHDLGHLPGSHDFENALDEMWLGYSVQEREKSPLKPLLEQQPGGIKPHERLGHALSFLLLKDKLRDLRNLPIARTAEVTFNFAQKILDADSNPVHLDVDANDARDKALNWLHGLVDGEIDCDRCDYILRDGRNYGFEFASYDLDRLLKNVTVIYKDEFFQTAIAPYGLSAVETFLIARYRSYQYGVRHHKVAQIGAALQHSIVKILSSKPDDPGMYPTKTAVTGFIDDLSLVLQQSPPDAHDLLKRFATYDDLWWMNIMRNVPAGMRDQWLELVCWREAGPVTLWKRRDEFPQAARLTEWNNQLPGNEDDSQNPSQDNESRRLEKLTRRRQWLQAASALRNEGVLVVQHIFRPWQVNPDDQNVSSLCVLQRGKSAEPISQVSPLIKSLKGAWQNDVQVQAFKLSNCPLSAEEVTNRLISL